MNDAYYFFSDVHFGLEEPEKERLKESKVIEFISLAQKDAKEIFIVGDLFDCWIEYKQVVPRGYYKLFTKISETVDKGIKINYIAGNHDFWKGDFFEKEFGIKICHSHIEKEIDGKKFFIHHGDGFANNDLGYRIIKRILRNNFTQKLYSLLHPDIGISIAKGTSHSSRYHTNNKDYSEHDGMRDFAFRKIDEGVEYVIMGHRHIPQMTRHNASYYINLGDWIEYFTYGVFKNNSFELKRFYDFQHSNASLAS